MRLWAGKTPFATLFANWERGDLAGGRGGPALYTFRLEPAGTAGGRVVDESGKPVAVARVQVELAGDLKPVVGDGGVRYDT